MTGKGFFEAERKSGRFGGAWIAAAVHWGAPGQELQTEALWGLEHGTDVPSRDCISKLLRTLG